MKNSWLVIIETILKVSKDDKEIAKTFDNYIQQIFDIQSARNFTILFWDTIIEKASEKRLGIASYLQEILQQYINQAMSAEIGRLKFALTIINKNLGSFN